MISPQMQRMGIFTTVLMLEAAYPIQGTFPAAGFVEQLGTAARRRPEPKFPSDLSSYCHLAGLHFYHHHKGVTDL